MKKSYSSLTTTIRGCIKSDFIKNICQTINLALSLILTSLIISNLSLQFTVLNNTQEVIFLSIFALIPIITANTTNVTSFMGLGGTALLIIVGVAMDVVKQIESFIISKQYEGMTI